MVLWMYLFSSNMGRFHIVVCCMLLLSLVLFFTSLGGGSTLSLKRLSFKFVSLPKGSLGGLWENMGLSLKHKNVNLDAMILKLKF